MSGTRKRELGNKEFQVQSKEHLRQPSRGQINDGDERGIRNQQELLTKR